MFITDDGHLYQKDLLNMPDADQLTTLAHMCPSCGNRIYQDEPYCPHCGILYEGKPKPPSPGRIYIWAFWLFVAYVAWNVVIKEKVKTLFYNVESGSPPTRQPPPPRTLDGT